MSFAFVSGSLGRAVFVSDGAFYTHDVGAPARPSSKFELAGITSRRSDFAFLDSVSLDSALSARNDEAFAEKALFLVLSSINLDLTFNTRLVCAQAVDPALSRSLQEVLLQRLLATPLPSEVRGELANALRTFVTFENLSNLLRELLDSQDAIVTVDNAITTVLSTLSSTDKSDARAEFIHSGVFLTLVRGLRLKESHKLNQGVVSARLALQAATENTIADEASRALGSALRRLLPSPFRQKELRLEPTKPDDSRSHKRPQNIDELIGADFLAHLPRFSAFAAKTIVDKQLSGIKSQIIVGRADLVHRYVTQLVQFQLDNSDRGQLAKSLCLLSSFALDSNQLEIAEELTDYAVRLDVNDEVVYTSRAEVLKNMGSFDASLMHYRDAQLRFSHSSYAWNGEADVLKEAARFDEALSAYKACITRFPDDSVPHNGYVSTLRRMGRIAEALRAARQGVRRFGDDLVTRAELGNVLLAAGRYQDAANEYRAVISADPRQIRTRLACARALNFMGEQVKALELLQTGKRWGDGPKIRTAIVNQFRTMGMLDKALESATQLVLDFPGYKPAALALASVLLLKGDALGAASHLPKDNLRSEADWQGYRIYLLCLLRGRDPQDAVRRLEEAKNLCVWFYQKTRIATILAIAHARAGSNKIATNILQDSSGIDDHQKQTRMALLAAVNASNGRTDLAETIFTRLLSTRDPTILNFKRAYLAPKHEAPSMIPLLLAA